MTAMPIRHSNDVLDDTAAAADAASASRGFDKDLNQILGLALSYHRHSKEKSHSLLGPRVFDPQIFVLGCSC